MDKLILIFSIFLLANCSTSKKSVKATQTLSPKQLIVQNQKELNDFYQNPETSPLKEKATSFKGHEFYPIDLSYRVEAEFVALENEPFFKMKTSGHKTPEYRRYGIYKFEIKGKPYELTVLQNKKNMSSPIYKNHLFLPFQDLTSGDTTYGGGRYIDMRIPKGNKVIIDFNLSYNPYCAYTDGYNCPIPPAENRLDVAIEAGIKLAEEYKH